MATHSSVLAWRIPGMVEPGGLLSMGSHRVGHDWSDLAAAAATFTSSGSSINDLWSQITTTNIIEMKNLEILQELPKCNTEIGSKQMLLEKWCQ